MAMIRSNVLRPSQREDLASLFGSPDPMLLFLHPSISWYTGNKKCDTHTHTHTHTRATRRLQLGVEPALPASAAQQRRIRLGASRRYAPLAR